MNKLEMKGDWNILQGQFKSKWAQFTDDGLQFVVGAEEALIGRIQQRTGQTRELVEKTFHDSDGGSSEKKAATVL